MPDIQVDLVCLDALLALLRIIYHCATFMSICIFPTKGSIQNYCKLRNNSTLLFSKRIFPELATQRRSDITCYTSLCIDFLLSSLSLFAARKFHIPKYNKMFFAPPPPPTLTSNSPYGGCLLCTHGYPPRARHIRNAWGRPSPRTFPATMRPCTRRFISSRSWFRAKTNWFSNEPADYLTRWIIRSHNVLGAARRCDFSEIPTYAKVMTNVSGDRIDRGEDLDQWRVQGATRSEELASLYGPFSRGE